MTKFSIQSNKYVVQVVSQEIGFPINNVQNISNVLYEGEQIFKLSSGNKYIVDLETWVEIITTESLNLIFKTRLSDILEKTESKIVKYSLKQKVDILQNKIAILLYKDLEKHEGNIIIQEIQEIQTSLKGDYFFNLTNEKLPQDLTNKLNLGRKCTLYVGFNFKTELEIWSWGWYYVQKLS